ncbi:bifunctional [glutamate--ammonia ligase]-adenylyl-L-tyrosine phosphorylase/[glutamate--ammonia-ligase] adenylyltransferase [Jeongeupia sp. USM3]|uniref:bifunctional [glutamate--ammonia ligase]-adenylyl-L-tyrosine phosphorylase/[glutamate--ammonia-ligase] adenylyltransferase n=1 Tax=Jeongeupia sp. USM3 TaxID=1906741 RepID=UPI00089DFE6C|nr:bifunctional [glutamate--ammonia ligase]-adenylyl-L-tyrosine phosphorylase/[glutamate--ammonia-ligase] adenylyltransferase [Jeongeupia sp. USM3]AOY01751.1 bifunctional glutamine synthetase adenylyltransferase/deadenyltransferase [Jeongeupia sp. USM3]
MSSETVTPTTLAPALAHSRYLQRLFTRHPELAAETAAHLYQPFTRAEMSLRLLGDVGDDAAFKRRLRRLRQAVMARLISRELEGLADLDEAVHTVSDLAELAVQHALAFVTRNETRPGQPIGEDSGEVQELIVVGMGKLGGRELNVSSDIDLIFVYPEDGNTDGDVSLTNHEYFARIGKKLIQLIDEATEDGLVFRVDMRLRPFGDSGPLVCSFAALENYLITQGREWERYAWIKGRALTGDGEALMQLIRPFVYRKYLDYGAYQSMRELHSQIRREVQRRDRIDNIKLGPGGIREIEFIGQVFQLIRGGRNKALTQRETRGTLAELGHQGLLAPETVAELQAAYAFLRNVEHRLMYIDDAQTQTLPANDDDRARIATSMGYADWPAFCTALASHRERVTLQFEQIFGLPQEATGGADDGAWQQARDGEQAPDALAAKGYRDAVEMARKLAAFAGGNRYQQMPDRCRQRVDHILPALIGVAAGYPNPDDTLSRLLGLLEAIGRRESYLALLAEHPQTLNRLAELYSASPWVSEYLTRHPILLDELLDARLLYQAPDWVRLGKILRQEIAELGDDTEAKMDCLRHFQHTQVFRIVAQDLSGSLPLEHVSDHLSALADLILAVTIAEVWRELPKRHCDVPRFAAIGYGKLGGKELGYGSDLDLVYLYDDPHPDAPENYARLAKKIVTWLTTLTSAGTLYDIDLRLRPNGTSGLLVSSVEAFAEYQRKSAWVWEHQALTRARFVCGETTIGVAFEATRSDILRGERDLAPLRDEVVRMRERMLETHPAKIDDVKHCRGGIVDIEFIVQYLVLAHAHRHPDLTGNLGNIALLGFAARDGLIDTGLAAQAQTAYRELRRLQHASRLNGTAPSAATLATLADALAAVRALWTGLFAPAQ